MRVLRGGAAACLLASALITGAVASTDHAPAASAVPVLPALPCPAAASGHVPSDTQIPLSRSTAAGQQAAQRLDSQVSAVARLNGVSEQRLSDVLQHDPGARVDGCGRLFFLEQTATDLSPDVVAPLAPAAGPLTTDGDAFALQSRPGADKTLYLDFTGTALSDTAWNVDNAIANGYRLAAYDTDGDSASFSTSERAAIKEIWLRVSEDYAPFAVNVTTADPGTAAIDRTSLGDVIYGATAVITSDTAMPADCGCGGQSYVDVVGEFAPLHAYYQPALVFSSALAGGKASTVAEATAHELGHQLGLLHSGSIYGFPANNNYFQGQGAWAPIMGNSYYKPLTQWSKGEYPSANYRDDQLSVIARTLPVVTDDHGATTGTGTALTLGVPLDGLITSAADRDAFTFTSLGGRTTVDVIPQTVGGDLDVQLDLYDAVGSLVSSANPAVPVPPTSNSSTTGLAASLTFAALPAGVYTAVVAGSGQGDVSVNGYTAYASLGRYTVTASSTALGPPTIATTSLPEATIGVAYVKQLAVSEGVAPFTWTLESGSLPPGISLSAGGLLTGMPSERGSWTAAVGVTDSWSRSSNRSLTLTVEPALVMTTSRLLPATVGKTYSLPLAATGGTGTFTWGRTAGTLPAGLSLSSAGLLHGVPTSTASTTFTVRVRDTASRSVSRTFTLAPARALLITTSARLPNAARSTVYSVTLTASGGAGGRQWKRTAGTLPPGLLLSATGKIAGKPTLRGSWWARITVKDRDGRASTRVFYLSVR